MATTTGLRYSLSQGKKSMSAAMQKASRSSVALALRRNSCNNAGEADDPANDNINTNGDSVAPVKPIPRTPPPSSRPSPRASKSAVASGTPAQMVKIFVLLLEPKTKTFELIQLVYPSATTTIGEILRMIPQHATELSLGSQKYVGLCRPKDEKELSDLSQLASASAESATSAMDSACVSSGEILVGIPSEFSVPEVAKFSQAILTNRRFTKLLRRNNPLAPKMRKHSDRKKDRKHKHKHHRSRDAVHILEKHDEAPEDAGDDEQTMQRALEKAASAAAEANAGIPNSPNSHHDLQSKESITASSPRGAGGGGRVSPTRHVERSNSRSSARSETRSVDSSEGASYASSYASSSWIDGGASTYSVSTAGADSLGDSLSSWSKSLDASFAKGSRQYSRHRNLSGAISPKKAELRRHQQKSSNTVLLSALVVVIGAYLWGAYMMDPHHRDYTERTETVKNAPMGMPGLLLVIAMLGALRKVQFLSNRRQRRMNNKIMFLPRPPQQSPCPAVRIYAKLGEWFA